MSESLYRNNVANGEYDKSLSRFFLEKKDDPDAYGHFIDYSRGPYNVLQ